MDTVENKQIMLVCITSVQVKVKNKKLNILNIIHCHRLWLIRSLTSYPF